MSFHPNDVARRARVGSLVLIAIFVALASAFFRAQVLDNSKYALQSEENRLRPIPLPAPRGIIYDRRGEVIAENLPAYSVSILTTTVDSLRAELTKLSQTVPLTRDQVESAVRRFRRDPNRPTVVIADASIDVISVLEEHRLNFPKLIIQSVPKRYYPDGAAVASFVGYTGEVSESQLNLGKYAGYKPGQQVGKGGLEQQYETQLRGQEGVRYDEVDARGRVLRQAPSRPDLTPRGAPPLYTNIDLSLQRYIAQLFADSLQGGAIAMDPNTGAVLALYSAPSFDPNRFTGGIPADYWRQLLADERRPLVNKVIQGRYPPGSTYKLANVVTALQAGIVTMEDKMPSPCTGGYQYGSRYFKCWYKPGHGNITLARAIEVSCDVYFYQLGLKLGLSRLVAGGISLGMRERSGIDLPEETVSQFPYADVVSYYNKRYGPRGWSNGVVLSLAIGQGENAQTVVNMAKLYTALATDGREARPQVVKQPAQRTQRYQLTQQQMDGMRAALAGVVAEGGTAAGSRIEGLLLAGKTGTAQNSGKADHAWFVGFAPADKPTIVVAVMLEFGLHGSRAARIASAIMGQYLKVVPATAVQTEG